VFDAFHEGGETAPEVSSAEPKPLYSVLKRVFDETSALVLLVLTLPLWLVIAMLVKMESPGPVLFVQERVGRHGRLFRLYKFRTLFAHTARYAVTPRSRRDPRMTPLGAFLRRTSLDELPQLINVLKGEMSLVGPRPEMPFMMRRNSPEYAQRLQVRPGMTGLWQAIARDEPLEESLRYDLHYIRHRSFLFDLMILARTFLTVFTGRGAV
jgi:lipopolysaccharide/colanic/teichoic acid biosynthesis glycosyltransferase